MPSLTLGTTRGLATKYGKEFALELFRRACRAHEFELQVKRAVEGGRIKIPVYLSLGTEYNAAALSLACEGFAIFAQHRCHSLYLCFGGDPRLLRDELLGLPTGLNGGRAGSNAIGCPEIGMFGHSGLLGEQVPIGVGYAMATRKPTLIIMGDAAAEEDYVSPSLGMAATHRLPVLFVVEDNDRSILTPVAVRRSWDVCSVAEGLGIVSIDEIDDPWVIHKAAHVFSRFRHLQRGPLLMRLSCCRVLWHAGAGNDGPPRWDRYATMKDTMGNMGLGNDVVRIESACAREMWEVWES